MHAHDAWGLDPRLAGWLAMGRPHRGGRGPGRHHRRRGGPGFGFGPPPTHRGPRARRGDVRAALLALLAEEPRNGYQLMQEIEHRSEGAWRPSPGSVYPALQQLEDEWLVRSEESGGRRLFHLTDEGRAAVEARDASEGAPWDLASEAVDPDVRGLFAAMKPVWLASVQLAQVGTPEQVAAAQKVLTEARRALYGILAEDAPEPADEADEEA
jgi:DNA-binding PadR family transcriptional regulator